MIHALEELIEVIEETIDYVPVEKRATLIGKIEKAKNFLAEYRRNKL